MLVAAVALACLEKMYNQNQDKAPPMSMSPRISFSNDFVESSSRSHSQSQNSNRAAAAYRDAPVSSDFEFSVSNYSMMSADELFFKGRLLPLKEGCSSSSGHKTTTLRDELKINNNNNEEEVEVESFALRPPKNPTRWKGFLGLRKSHIGSKKPSPSEKRTSFHHDQCNNNNSQDHDD